MQGRPLVFVCNPPYDDELLNARAGTEEEKLSRRRALERSFLPLDVLCAVAIRSGCQSLWILWGNAEDAPVEEAALHAGMRILQQVRFQRNVHTPGPFATAWHLCPASADTSLEEAVVKETILWYDAMGAPS
ncbi:CPK28, partial [Symbiodinium pilosum]